MNNMRETLGVPSYRVDTAFAMAIVRGLDDGTLDGEPTQDGGGVAGDSGTEPRRD